MLSRNLFRNGHRPASSNIYPHLEELHLTLRADLPSIDKEEWPCSFEDALARFTKYHNLSGRESFRRIVVTSDPKYKWKSRLKKKVTGVTVSAQ